MPIMSAVAATAVPLANYGSPVMPTSKWQWHYTDYLNKQPRGRPASPYEDFLAMKRDVVRSDIERLTADLSSLEAEIERVRMKGAA